MDYSKESDIIHKQHSNLCVFLLCLGLMGFYVRVGIGSGYKVANQIKEDSLEFEDKLTSMSNDPETVHLLGKNSSFIFYLPNGESNIKITPTNSGNLKSIVEKR